MRNCFQELRPGLTVRVADESPQRRDTARAHEVRVVVGEEVVPGLDPVLSRIVRGVMRGYAAALAALAA